MTQLARKCCCGEGTLACGPWCECSPAQITLQIRIQQTMEIIDDTPCGTYVVLSLEDDLTVNVVLQKDCPCSYLTASGNWEYTANWRQLEYPSQAIYVNNNPSYRPCPPDPCPCTTPVLCSERVQTGSGDLDTLDVRIDCDELCSNCAPQCSCFTAPQNVLRLNIPIAATETTTNYNECLLDLGAPPPGPYPVAFQYLFGMIGFDGCIDLNTFTNPAIEMAPPWTTPFQLYQPLTYYPPTCIGEYPRHECDPVTGAITFFRGKRWEVEGCKTTLCKSHVCYNNSPQPGNLVYECGCPPIGNQQDGQITRRLKHSGKYSVTMTIP